MANKFLTYVFEHSKVRRSELAELLSLADRANSDGVCYPSIKDIAQRSRASVRQTQRALRRLERAGELRIVTGGRGPHKTSWYIIVAGRDSTTIDALRKSIGERLEGVATVTPMTPSEPDEGDVDEAARVTPMTPLEADEGDVDEAGRVTPVTPLEARKGDIGDGVRVTSRARMGDMEGAKRVTPMTPEPLREPRREPPPEPSRAPAARSEVATLAPVAAGGGGDGRDAEERRRIEAVLAAAGVGMAKKLSGLPHVTLAKAQAAIAAGKANGGGPGLVAEILRVDAPIPTCPDAAAEYRYPNGLTAAAAEQKQQRRQRDDEEAADELEKLRAELAAIPGGELSELLEVARTSMIWRPAAAPTNWREKPAWLHAVRDAWRARQRGGELAAARDCTTTTIPAGENHDQDT